MAVILIVSTEGMFGIKFSMGQVASLQNGWIEFDTNEDYENTLEWQKKRILERLVRN